MYTTIIIIAAVTCALIALAERLLVRAARRRSASWASISRSAPPICRMLQPGSGIFDSQTGEEVEGGAALRERISQALWDGNIDEAKQHSAELQRRANEGSENHD